MSRITIPRETFHDLLLSAVVTHVNSGLDMRAAKEMALLEVNSYFVVGEFRPKHRDIEQ